MARVFIREHLGDHVHVTISEIIRVPVVILFTIAISITIAVGHSHGLLIQGVGILLASHVHAVFIGEQGKFNALTITSASVTDVAATVTGLDTHGFLEKLLHLLVVLLGLLNLIIVNTLLRTSVADGLNRLKEVTTSTLSITVIVGSVGVIFILLHLLFGLLLLLLLLLLVLLLELFNVSCEIIFGHVGEV